MRPAAARSYRFGTFEVNPSTRTLTDGGKPVVVTPRVFELLLYLVRHPGRLLTKEELMKSVWGDLAVEEGNLTQSVFLLRKVLSSGASGPIVTVPGRGYQFAVAVDEIEPEEPLPLRPVPPVVQLPEVVEEVGGRRSALRYVAVSLIAMALIALLLLLRTKPKKSIALPHLLATNSSETYPVLSIALSRDGKYLAYTSPNSLTLQTLNSNETLTIPLPRGTVPVSSSWYPDGTHLLVCEKVNDLPLLAVFSILSGKLTPLRENAASPVVSDDGSRIVFAVNFRELWLMGGNGENPRRILPVDAASKIYPMFWSPDGKRVWFARVKWDKRAETITLESCEQNGAGQTVALTDDRARAFLLLAGGRLIFARKEETHNFTNLWELPVNTATGKWEGAPRQLTEWSNFSVSQLSSSADGKRVAFLNGGWRADVMTGDLKTSREGMQLLNTRRLTLGRGDDAPAFWTADDQAVVFESDRNGRSQIFRQRLDQTAAELLSMDSGETQGLHFGGAWIYYHSLPAGGNMLWDQPVAVRRIPIRGGASSEVMKGVGLEIDCSLSRPEICVVGQLENKILTFYRFDHEKGRGAEVGRLPYDSRRSPSFAVSPDGSEVAAIDPKGSGNWIRRIPFNGGPSSEVELRGRKELTALYWAPDGKGWVAASTTPNNGEYLLHVDLHGDSQILYEQREDGRDTWGIPSHNGKQLAFLRWIAPKDVWMIDNF